MCPDESSDERRGVMPSPPSSDAGELEDEPTEEFGIYSRIELIRLFLPLQKFTSIPPDYELDQDDESSLCSLWDAINDSDIADFYIENGLVPVLKMIISNNNCVNDRLTELSAGILANVISQMSYQPTVKEFVSEEFDLTKYILLTNDSLTLIQFIRLVKSALDDSFYLHRNPETTYFMEDLHLVGKLFNSDLKDKIGFIMKNSKNKDLLNNTAALLKTASGYFSNKKVQKSNESLPELLNDEALWLFEWSIFDYKPMRIGLYSSLDTYLEDFSVLDNDDNINLYNSLILIYNIIQIGKAAPHETQFNCEESFSFVSICFGAVTKAIINNKQELITTLTTDDYEISKDVFECIIQLAEILKLCSPSITEANTESIEVLRIVLNLCKLLNPKNDETLGRNTKEIIETLQNLITVILTASQNQEDSIHQILQQSCFGVC